MAAGSHWHATVRAVGSLPSTVSAIISSSEPALSWAPSAAFSHNRALWGSGNNVLSLRDISLTSFYSCMVVLDSRFSPLGRGLQPPRRSVHSVMVGRGLPAPFASLAPYIE